MTMSLAHERLPPAPRFCRTAQLTDRGIVLGEGVVRAPLARRADGAAALAVEGREAEIFALLSLARGGAIRPNVLHGLRGVAKSLAQGEIVGAMIRLAQIGLPPLRGPRDAEMLKTGADFLGKGFSPWTLLRAAGIEGADVSDEQDAPDDPETGWNPDLHPRDPATGRFIAADGAVAIPVSLAGQLIASAAEVSSGVFALAGGALLSLTAAGWVLSHGLKGDIQDGACYWLPGVSCETSSGDEDGKEQTPGIGHNGGPALDGTPRDPGGQGPEQKPSPAIVSPTTSSAPDSNASSGQSGDATAESNPVLFTIESKISRQMEARGWTSDLIAATIANPAQTIPAEDNRFNQQTGVRRNDPATAYVNADGSYVVINNTDGTVVQLSDRNDPDWKKPWEK
jgi:hypothetical protein